MADRGEKVRKWYDGFCFGDRNDIYNPWSITKFLDTGKFDSYWVNTSSNSLAGKLIQEGTPDVKISMEDLLEGKAIKTAVTKSEEKWKALTDDKLTEAEKLAKMTKEEKAEYRAKKAEKELEELKKMNARTELAKTARKMLADENINIPDELLGNLVADDADGTKTAVESFAKMYKEAVQAAVKEAIKGKPPKAGTGGGNTITKEQIMDIKDPIERQKMIRENINLFQ